MCATALFAGECGGENELGGGQSVRLAVSIAERVHAVEGGRQTGVLAYDTRMRLHQCAYLRPNRLG